MSILDNAPHIITVFTAETVADLYGNPVTRPSSESVEARCLVTPMSSQLRERPDERPPRRFKLIVRDVLLSLHSRVVFNNQSYIVESVLTHETSDATRHTEAVLREEG
jgi:hypothetical protein